MLGKIYHFTYYFFSKCVEFLIDFLPHINSTAVKLQDFSLKSLKVYLVCKNENWKLSLELCILVRFIFLRVLYSRASYDRENTVLIVFYFSLVTLCTLVGYLGHSLDKKGALSRFTRVNVHIYKPRIWGQFGWISSRLTLIHPLLTE